MTASGLIDDAEVRVPFTARESDPGNPRPGRSELRGDLTSLFEKADRELPDPEGTIGLKAIFRAAGGPPDSDRINPSGSAAAWLPSA